MFSVIQRLNDRRQDVGEDGEDAGFTLIELMVVLLILAILLAIAIPTFLGVTKSANDRAAQSNLNSALTNVKSYFQQNSQSYTTAATLVATMATQEPSLQWTTGNSTGQGQVSVFVSADGQGVILADQSKNGSNCWYAVDQAVTETGAGTPYVALAGYGTPANTAGTFYGVQKNAATCNASSPPATGAGTRSRAKASRRAHKQGLTADPEITLWKPRESECAPLHVEGGAFLPDPSVAG